MHFLTPDDLPPEVLASFRHRVEMEEMNAQEKRHSMHAFFKERSADELQLLRQLMHAGRHDPEVLIHFEGVATTLLDLKFDQCPCGGDHDAEGLLQTPPPEEQQPDEPVNTVGGPGEFGSIEEQDMSGVYDPTVLEEYGMEYVPVPDNPRVNYLRCAKCKTPSVSMSDRMLRDPGVKGCETCKHTEKWG